MTATIDAIPQSRPGRILVAEDDGVLRELLQLQLRELGLDCKTVADGLEAVEEVPRGDYDVVLLDMEMPRMNGWEAASILRARGYDRPILALTAHESAGAAQRALDHGCDRVLSKPYDLETLRGALAPLLAVAKAAAGAQNAIVHVDPRIADLAEKFLRDTRRDAARLHLALENRDLDQLRRLGHTLRGSAASFGLDQLARLGSLLENAARDGDVDSAARVAAQLVEHLASVEIRPG